MTFLAQRNHTAPDLRNSQDIDTELLKLLEAKGADPDFWSSKDRDRSDSAHSIFQYPAMMVPVVQRRLLGAVLEVCPEIQSVYDPFMGSGTSLVSGMHYGLDVYGNDINPLAVLISRVRTSRTVGFAMEAVVEQVAAQAKADQRQTIETSMDNREKWFQHEVAVELSRLRRAIRDCRDLWVRRFLWVTLAETVRLTSNDRTSTYKLHARPADEIARVRTH
jgi:adenine-specific DNA methylase